VVLASIVVCTRNRAARLSESLARLADQVVVAQHGDSRHRRGGTDHGVDVDNGSTDGTAALAADWCGDDPRHRRLVSEPVAGLSRARNRGVGAARADVVLFIDDDAVAVRSAATGGQAVILDELARRSGHLAAAVELVWLGVRRDDQARAAVAAPSVVGDGTG
jgi:hypothetical protein